MRMKDGRLAVGLDALAAKEEKVEQGLGKIGRGAKQAEAELDRFAKRTTAINATPLEKYQTQMQRLDQALARGKISQETFARAATRAGDALRRAGEAQKSSLQADALGQIKSFAAGYLTLSSAVRLVGDAFRHARQESQEALSSLRGLDDPRRKLVQMAESPEQLTAMLQRADAAAVQTGVDRATAYDVLFQAESFGFSQDYEKILGANEVINAGAAAQLAGKVRTMFGGKITGEQAINMALAAGKPSEVDAESIAGSLAMALEGGRRVGATPDETFAWVSALSAAFKSPQVAADRIKAITNRAAQHPELRGAGGMTEIMQRLVAMPEEERAEILKNDQETNAAFEAMLEFHPLREKIEAEVRQARLASGTADAPLAQGMRNVLGSDKSAASLAVRRAEILKEISKENQLAVAEADRQVAIDRMKAAGHDAGMGVFQRFGMDKGARAAAAMELGPGAVAGMAGAGAAAGGAINGDAAGGGFGFWRFVARLIEQQYAEQRMQTSLLEEIAAGGGRGGGQAAQREALAPLN